MQRLYLDTEFDGLGGPLISMALVSASDGEEFYEVLPTIAKSDWVLEHVMPKLGKWPIEPRDFAEGLWRFLSRYDGCEIIADWPADFSHLCDQMSRIGANLGFSIPIECKMTLLRGSPDIAPENPHNALSDAHALRVWHQNTLRA